MDKASFKSRLTLSSSSSPSFGTCDDGSLHSSAAVEDTDFDQEDEARDPRLVVPLVLGRGHRTKRCRRLFGDEPNWE